MDERKRTFNTPIRERWNVPIHNILKAIDNHTALFLATGNPWHEEKAGQLRQYVHELKTCIHAEELAAFAPVHSGAFTEQLSVYPLGLPQGHDDLPSPSSH
jgi:hypothetical protein